LQPEPVETGAPGVAGAPGARIRGILVGHDRVSETGWHAAEPGDPEIADVEKRFDFHVAAGAKDFSALDDSGA
jgi:hypothetical protein